MKYFIIENDKQQGPFSIYELKDKAISQETLVWAEGMEDWTPANKVEELRNFLFATTSQSVPPPYVAPKAAPAEEPMTPPRKKSRKGCLVFLFLLLLLLAAMALTCPSKEQHQQKIQEKVTLALEQSVKQNNDLWGAGLNVLNKMLKTNLLNAAFDGLLDYHNYYLFSKTTTSLAGKEQPVSYGVLGMIFTVHEDKISEYLNKNNPMSVIESITELDDAVEESITPDESKEAEPEDLGNKVIKKMGTMIKKHVTEQTDSAQGSAWGKIIDGVTDMLKNNLKAE